MDGTLQPLRDPLLHVSRETFKALKLYENLVKQQTRSINLIAETTVPFLWQRHIVDSLQIIRYCPAICSRWLDIGSGAGFPGLVVAIALRESFPDLCVTLVESNQRKAAFLETVIIKLHLNAQVKAHRIETLPNQNAQVISARAVADLSRLLAYTRYHLTDKGVLLLLKGKSVYNEIDKAKKTWSFQSEIYPSVTCKHGYVLKLKDIACV